MPDPRYLQLEGLVANAARRIFDAHVLAADVGMQGTSADLDQIFGEVCRIQEDLLKGRGRQTRTASQLEFSYVSGAKRRLAR
jgi:hypothetical protein